MAMTRKEFVAMGAAAALAPRVFAKPSAPSAENNWGVVPDGILVRFMGTGASDWLSARPNGEFRRWSSTLFDNKVLIDFTHFNYPSVVTDPNHPGHSPKICFYTHSHRDHYEPAAAIKMGFERVYVHETWHAEAVKGMADAAAKAGVKAPDVRAVKFGEWYEEEGMKFMPLPANHATSLPHELSCIYLVQKGKTRLLYATDTAGIMGSATRLGKFDAHRKLEPLTAIIMEATIGMGMVDDFRIFNHSTVEQVRDTVKSLTKSGAYKPPKGQCVYINHLAKTLHPEQAVLNKTLPEPIKAAYDCLEVVMR